jgi:hypothetical protein
MSKEPSQLYKTVKLDSIKAEAYLGEAVLVQKSMTKPLGPAQWECSQDRSVMVCLDEARQRYSGGCRVGLTVVRASAPMVKHESPASVGLPKGSVRLLSSANRVLGGATWRKWSLTHTGEVPLCPRLTRGVTSTYKVHPKWSPHARVKRMPP